MMDLYADIANEIVAETEASGSRESGTNAVEQPIIASSRSQPISAEAKPKRKRRQASARPTPSKKTPAVTPSGVAGAAETMLTPLPLSSASRRQSDPSQEGGSEAHILDAEGHEELSLVSDTSATADECGALHPCATLTGDPPALDNSSPEDGDGGARLAFIPQEHDSPTVAEIIQLWRLRQSWHRAEKSLVLQGRALCRRWTDGDKDAANKLYDAEAKGNGDDPQLTVALLPFLGATGTFAPERARIEKELRKLAKSLPVFPWVASVKGFGDLNLAAIVGEAGDIGSYRNPSCLWKRMGLAVIDGGRQRRIADAEQALVHGYNPNRRCVSYLLGDTLIKGNGEGPYRTAYLARKEYELAREDEGKADKPIHIHRRAARYMTKRALRDLWAAWRAADRGHLSYDPLPSGAPVGAFREAA